MTKFTNKRAAQTPAEDEWQLAYKAFLRLEDRRRKAESVWRRAAMKRLGPAVFSMVELGWAAGFWDGEGHVSARERNGEFDCSLDQADRVPLERLQSALGVGRISPVKRRLSAKGKMQFLYTFRITNQRDLQRAWLAMGLHLGSAKRDQFASALSVPLVTLMRKEKTLPNGTKSVTATGQRRRLSR